MANFLKDEGRPEGFSHSTQASDQEYSKLIKDLVEIYSIPDPAYREFKLRRLASKAKVGGKSGLEAIAKLHFEGQQGGQQ